MWLPPAAVHVGSMRTLRAGLIALAAGATLWGAEPSHSGQMMADPPGFLRTQFGLGARDLAALDRGQVIARVVDSGDNSEVFAVAAVRVHTTVARVRQQLEAFEGRRRPSDVLQAGRLGPAPAPADLAGLTLDGGDLSALGKCKPGDCDVRLPAAVIQRFRREIDWSSPQRAPKASALWHEVLAGTAAGYVGQGDATLFQYDNNDMPVKVGDSLARVLARSGYLAEAAPDLYRYLVHFPQDRPARAEDYLYWIKEKFWIKTVVSLNHVAIVAGDGPSGPYVVGAVKQIYANHYFESSVSVTTFAERAPYLLYVSRTRADIRASGFNFLERLILRRLVEGRLEAQIRSMRDRLEGRDRPSAVRLLRGPDVPAGDEADPAPSPDP